MNSYFEIMNYGRLSENAASEEREREREREREMTSSMQPRENDPEVPAAAAVDDDDDDDCGDDGENGCDVARFGYCSLADDGGDEGGVEDEIEGGQGRVQPSLEELRSQTGLAERMLAREEEAYRACLAMEGRLGGGETILHAPTEEEQEDNIADQHEGRTMTPTAEANVASAIDEDARQAGPGARDAVEVTPLRQEDVSFIRNSMQGLQLDYKPPWADGLKDNDLIAMVSRTKRQ